MSDDRALIVVDLQRDFMPDGALPAAGGYDVVPVANRLMRSFDLVVATQDWHPSDHGSFASNHQGHEPGDVIELDGLDQILWPDHCVQDTNGADFVDALETDQFDEVFRKGVDPDIDSYSGFFDNGHRRATGMGDYLRQQGVDEIFIVGVATDYCVKFTALDGCELDFETWVCTDGIAGVENEPGDIDTAIGDMRDAGVRFTDSGALENRISDT